MSRFTHLRLALFSTPWAIMKDRFDAVLEVFERRIEDGIRYDPETVAAIRGPRGVNGVLIYRDVENPSVEISVAAYAERAASGSGSSGQPSGVIAVINVMGIIAQHASQVDGVSGPGGTSTERVTNSLRQALSDPAVKAIVFNVDSPGGSVSGVQALAAEIFEARGRKPMVTQVNSLAASAAYWIGVAPDEMIMTPGSQAGSIGVYTSHRDVSKAMDQMGVVTTFISAGEYKVEGHPFAPLGDDAKAYQQSQVDAYYSDFIRDVARFRGTTVEAVRSGYGKGRVVKDRQAVKAGMADGIGTLDQTIQRLAAGKSAATGKRAGASAAVEEDSATSTPIIPAGSAAAAAFQSIVMNTTTSQDGRQEMRVASPWPLLAVIFPDDFLASALEANGEFGIGVDNGHARYRKLAESPAGDWYCSLLESSFVPPTPEGTKALDVDADAFRRRRHAMRARAR